LNEGGFERTPSPAISEFGQFHSSLCVSWCLLSGEVKDPTEGHFKACHLLIKHLIWNITQQPTILLCILQYFNTLKETNNLMFSIFNFHICVVKTQNIPKSYKGSEIISVILLTLGISRERAIFFISFFSYLLQSIR